MASELALGVSRSDLRLGARMLLRYPVLTLIATASLAVAIAIGAAVFAFISLLLRPTLPLPDGDRVVSVRLVDVAANQNEARLTADFLPGATRQRRSPISAPAAASSTT